MRTFRPALALACIFAAFAPSFCTAGPAADALSLCMADNTTGKERKALARWVFAAISAHPEMSDLSAVNDAMREDANREMASIVTKLVTQSCPAQAAEAQAESTKSLASAFEALGKLAMVELMSNPQVAASISGFSRYLDNDKIEAVLKKPAKD